MACSLKYAAFVGLTWLWNAHLPLRLEIVVMDQWAGTKIVLGALELLIWAHAHHVEVTNVCI